MRHWSETCDTLHAHTQLLGKLAAQLAPPEPQLQHAALRLTARGWETPPLPAPDDSGALVVALDLHAHEAVVEHSGGQARRVAADAGPVGGERHARAAGGDRRARRPGRDRPRRRRRCPGACRSTRTRSTHATTPTRSPLTSTPRRAPPSCSPTFRAPYRGRSTPVNAWWGSFDLAVSLFSGLPAEPPSDDFIMRNSMDAQEVAVGWWPGDPSYAKAAFYAYAHPAPDGFADGERLSAGRPLGRRAGPVRPRLGRRARERRSARRRARVRPLGLRPRLHGLRVGPRAGRERGRDAAAGHLAL